MSKPLFEFVKVAAGDRFPFKTGMYTWSIDEEANETFNGELTNGTTFFGDVYILRPAESPDAGREDEVHTFSRERLQATLSRPEDADQYFPVPDVPATNVGDIPAGREGFIQKVMDEVEGPHPYPRRSEICSMFENAMRLHWPTPADPGSQVEAVGLLKWIEANSWECFYDGKWRKRINGVVQQKTHEELATLYKQSL